MVPFVVLAVLPLLALAGYWVVRPRAARAEERFFVFRCDRCGQKVRYLAEKAGRPGKCPRCKTPCLLPSTPQDRNAVAYNRHGYPVKVGQVLR
jgi:hypothetical protein